MNAEHAGAYALLIPPRVHRGSGMKARLPEAAGGRPGPAGRSGPASFSGPSSRTKAGDAAGAGTPVSGALGAALAASLLAAALLLAPGAAQSCVGQNTAFSGTATCTAATYPNSIRTITQSNASLTIRVPGGSGTGGAATVITAVTIYPGIDIDATDNTQTGNYAIYVGTTSAVNIVDDTGSGNASVGIRILQDGSGTALVDVGSQVTIGTSSSSRMRQHGIYVRSSSSSAGAATVTNAGTIYATYEGLDVKHDGAGTTTVTHSGTVDSLNHGIWARADGTGPLIVTSSGDVTVTNANQQGIRMESANNGAMTLTATGGTITTPAQGIYMESRGTGTVTIKGTAADAETQSGPTITSSASHGVHVHKSGSSATAGDVSITTTGGSITAGTGTSHGIHVQDRSGYTGNVTIDNAADVTASGGRGINVDRLGSGSVSVTVAAGTTVTGGTAGVYVAGAATGLQVARKYTSGYAQGQSADEIVTMAALRNQLVTVAGRVIGGTDAAVRLSGGGGVLVLEGGEVRAGADSGDSGVGILADGSALVYIDGLVRGAAGGAAAVHLTGGGSVTVGPNGRVQANGADHAIKSDGTNAITLTLVTAGMYREDAETAYARVDGSIEDVAAIRFREDLNGVPTGYSTSLTVTAAGVDTRKLPSRSQPPTEPPLSCPERADGRCIITQPGTISGRTGVYAAVEEDSATVASQPLIDVTWTGTFSHAEGNEGRFTAASAADVLSFDREAAAVKAQEAPEGSVRYGGAAGIEAHALSWRDVAEQVAKGDDPGALANAAAQTALVPTSATAHNNAYVKQFKAALENDEIEVESAVLTAIGTTATTAVTDLTDAQIVTYLRTDDEATRALLRNVLARGLSDAEKAVLRAVATNTGLDDALNDADAGFSNAYKTAVRDLLDRYNVGDIRIAVNGGSIDSRGDGIRAYYATPHANNGGISVTVAEGASVTGAMAGVYVANAGGDVTVSNSGTVKGGTYGIYAANAAAANGAIEVTVAAGASVTGDTAGVYAANAGPGLMLARKYTPGYSEENKDRAEELVPVMHGGGADAVPLLNQLVRVHGTVTGGTDAAVHLNGGGAVLVMEGGRVHAGTSGVAIKVNDPGPALVHVEGEVKGGAGPDGAPAPAAVHLTGGGNVIIGLNGKVKAAGAARAIRGGGDEATMVALTLVTDGIITHREDAQEAYARVEGSTEDIEGDVRFREDRDGVPTGYSRMLPVGDDGMLDASTLEWGPCPDETHIRGDDGVCGTPPPGSGDDGSGDDGSGSDGSGDDGSGDDGSGDDGSGDDGSGDDGSGDDGSGDDGSGDDGSGDDGSGDDGSGDDGSGDDGSGDDGSGSDGSGDDGSGSDGSGDDGSGAGVRVVVAAGGTVSRDDGIRAYYETPHDDNGGIEVTVAEGASVSGSVAGIYVANAGPGLRIPKRYAPKAIQELKANEDAGKDDLIAIGGLNAAGDAIATPYLNQLVTIAGTVTGGTDAAVHLVGGGAVIVMKGGRVHAGSSGVAIKVNDPGPALMYIDGEVKGGAGGAAAVHLTGGGSVIIGQEGKVEANGAARAIRGGGDEATKVALTLVTDDVIMYREDADEAYDARVEGSLADVGEVRFREDKNGIPTGYSKPLPVTDNGMLDPSELPSSTFSCEEAGDRRCRLYEALPSMLLAMNGLPSYAERTSAVRDGNGGWARVETARGEWQAKKAETETMGGGKLAYDHRRSVGRAGIDFLAGESARVGVSVHALRGKAEMGGVGEVELDGMGGGLSATWLVGGLYVDAQAAVTLYDVDVESSRHGKMPKKDVYGAGYGLGVDVGRRMSVGGMLVTPRAGVGWSKVELDDFTDMERYGGPRARVSVEEAVSVKGRLGVMLEMEVGSGGTSGQVFGSLDVEGEFSDETEVKVGGKPLKTEVRPTAVRVGLGGEFAVADGVVVRATGGFRTSGSGTSGYGGGLELRVRF